ncbi:MAG: HD domain-containing protein [Treponema sp.]|nr:HD domain-containing protein [Treponema sp.]
MLNDGTHEQKLQQIAEIEKRLSEIKDEDILLENILVAACEIVNADAGSIYSFDESSSDLTIRYSVNKTLQNRLAKGEKLPFSSFKMTATSQSISGYCALNKTIINIPDVYNMDEFIDKEKTKPRPYNFNQLSDLATSYRTKSMLTFPLTMTNGRVLGVLQIINAADSEGNIIPFDTDSEFYISHFASSLGQIYEYAYLTKQLIERLVRMAGYRDPKETGAHVERVSSFSVEIYDRYASNKNIPKKEREKFRDTLKLAAKCHDVGKVAIPDVILKKNGPLTDEERSIMKGHTCIGAQIFTPVESELDAMARDVCLHHHDRWDGGAKGYPGRFEDYMSFEPGTPVPPVTQIFKGEDIPLAARIVAVADVYDALRHMRSYKKEWTADMTFEEIQNERGKQFDPDLVDAFVQIRNRLEAINKSLTPEE